MPEIAPETRMGPVHLTVADLDRSRAFYGDALGLSDREDLLVFHEEPGARPVQGHTGLYHYALLLPERVDLARWLAHAARSRIPLTGLSDHIVSEAIYLRDPDDHGIEIYADRPRERWEKVGDQYRMATDPLDTRSLLSELDGRDDQAFEGLPEGTTMGHVHLHVADIDATDAFYRDVVGFNLMARLGDQASFFAADGYHHHVGANVWAGVGATPPPPGSAALRHATVVLPDTEERERVVARVADAGGEPVEVEDGILVRDPSQNALVLAVE
jgi:catechol 2,3-dioxygenase